ncbi:hypothetical protein [Nocardia jinanensis]|uniref:Mce-associated membrane protein n=1 Tax=Nocardia jinanensis TaxID=382504 RepID=A0A917RMW6_9NOCA|nr:hypothetical protein [Nocardia jinanensis]GGL14289.1 hypothetical protein GCM10011588_31020 [Nocardia jinanensis]
MPEKSSATAVIDTDDEQHMEAAPDTARTRRPVTDRAVSVRAALAVLVVVAVVAVVGVVSWQWRSAAAELGSRDTAAADRQHAEQVALDYATGAAQMNFENPQEWRARLTANTTPELNDRLTKAATSMEQLIGPLQWSSSAHPIAAKVESESGGIFRVICFVDVLTKNVQAPEGIQSTATYKLSIDSGRNWLIAEISGIDAPLGGAAPR